MPETAEGRVAVYIDFDNIVISQYDRVHGRGAFTKDRARSAPDAGRLDASTVDIGAVLDFASSFGAIAISRAYADWSSTVNSRYRQQLVDRAVELTQLFPAAGTKNGADIRLAIDVVEELFRLQDITHVVIVAGDSDYIPLAQTVRRLGRVVVGVGVTGSTSAAFRNAVDEFAYYADLAATPEPEPQVAPVDDATALLQRALRVTRGDVDEWRNASALKQQMKRLDPAFDEKTLGFSSFTGFIRSRDAVAELQEDGQERRVRLRS